MRPLPSALLWAPATILGAHALTYGAVQYLPDPINTVLGLQSGSVPAREALLEAHPVRSYGQVLTDLMTGNLGTTRDGVPVASELAAAVSASAPRVAVAVAMVLAITALVAFLPRARLPQAAAVGSVVTFFPPFLAPFLFLWVYIEIQAAGPSAVLLAWWLCTLSVAVPAVAFTAAQAALVMQRNLDLPFARTIRAAGASESRLRVRLTHHLAVEMTPTLEKLGIGLFTALLFAEPAFGEPGLGSLLLRAIRRTDIDLIVAAVAGIAAAIVVLRIASAGAGSIYGLRTR